MWQLPTVDSCTRFASADTFRSLLNDSKHFQVVIRLSSWCKILPFNQFLLTLRSMSKQISDHLHQHHTRHSIGTIAIWSVNPLPIFTLLFWTPILLYLVIIIFNGDRMLAWPRTANRVYCAVAVDWHSVLGLCGLYKNHGISTFVKLWRRGK